MSYTAKDFVLGLKQQLTEQFDVVKISRWAHQEFLKHCRDTDPELQSEVIRIIAMEEGPEFEMTEQQILKLIDNLSVIGDQPGRMSTASPCNVA